MTKHKRISRDLQRLKDKGRLIPDDPEVWRLVIDTLPSGRYEVSIDFDDGEEPYVYVECSFCDRRASALMPQSTDLGQTLSMVYCCTDHRSGWWDGADWDGRHLEIDL